MRRSIVLCLPLQLVFPALSVAFTAKRENLTQLYKSSLASKACQVVWLLLIVLHLIKMYLHKGSTITMLLKAALTLVSRALMVLKINSHFDCRTAQAAKISKATALCYI
jgi:hypothetical protein